MAFFKRQLDTIKKLAESEVDSALDRVRQIRSRGKASADFEFQLGRLFESLDLKHEALEAYWHSVNHGRQDADIYERMAGLYESLGFGGRTLWYRAAAAKNNKLSSQAMGLLARTQSRIGMIDESLRTYRRAMKLDGANAALHSDYLFALLHADGPSPVDLRDANERWCSCHCHPLQSRTQFSNAPSPKRRLRLGYLCAEFRRSPAYHVVPPLIETHDRGKFEIYCYHLSEIRDEITAEYETATDHWRDVGGCDPGEIKERILQDRIDILVERSGHIASPLGIAVCQRRAAPVQVAHLNYPCTTGCREIDYLVSDHWTSLDDEQFCRQYSERAVYRLLSGCIVYRPQSDAPQVSPLPAKRTGHITFGLFQRPSKLNDDVWDAIAAILQNVPTARLLVQHADRELGEPGSFATKRALRALSRRGISRDRVQLEGARDKCDYPSMLARADIALDSFPYSGEITTCTCLWMGVPVVTLAGERHASRVSGSILARIGLDDWVGKSAQEYIGIATAKAADAPALAKLRAGLRKRMARSSVCRPEIVVRELEEGYRWMWERWCGDHTGASEVSAARKVRNSR